MITLTLTSETTLEKALEDYQKILSAHPKEQDFSIKTNDGQSIAPDILGKVISRILSSAEVATLNLSNLGITDIVLAAIENVLSKEDTLKSLDLSHNYIGDEGTKTLTQILQNNKAIVKCDISDNEITNVGAKALEPFLQKNNSLKTLKITHNKISDEKCFLNNNLVFLDADYNQLTKLDSPIHLSPKVLWFNFDKNDITTVSKECLYAFNREQATLDLSRNPLDEETKALLGDYEYAKFDVLESD